MAGPGMDEMVGSDRPTWRERLDAVGAGPLVRQHPVLVGVGATMLSLVVLGVGGLVVDTRDRPPADDGAVAVLIWDVPLDSASTTVGPDDPQAAYAFSPRREGDSVTVLGLEGPGVLRSTVTVPRSRINGLVGADAVLTVEPRCDDPALVTAEESDYHLRLQRTDVYGRTVVSPVDLPASANQLWAAALGRRCVTTWIAESIVLEGVDVRADLAPPPDGPAVTLDLRLRNAMPVDVRAGLTGWGAPVDPGAPNSGTLRAGSTTVLPLRFAQDDCRGAGRDRGEWDPSFLLDDRRLEVVVREPRVGQIWAGLVSGPFELVFSPEVRRRVAVALGALCAGAPEVSVEVVSATPTRDADLTAPLRAAGYFLGPVLRVRVRVASSATRVTASDASPPSADGSALRTLTSDTSALRGGVTTVTLHWAATCGIEAGPPPVRLVLTAQGRRYPALEVLDDAVLARVLLRTCPQLTPSGMRDAGWALPP